MIDMYFGVAVWSTTGFLSTFDLNIGGGRRERVVVFNLPNEKQLMIGCFLSAKEVG